MRKCLAGLVGAGLLALLGNPGLEAAEAVPRLDYDFGAPAAVGIPDRAGSGLHLKPGKAARIADGALVFNGAADSVASADEAAFRTWAKGVDLREISAAFWIRFDKRSDRTQARSPALGLFDCRIGEDGFLELICYTAPTEIMAGEWVMRSKTRVELGTWYQVAFNFSSNRRRYSLYVDGRWQMENDQLVLPALALGSLRLGQGFRGAIKDLKFYDVALESEALTIADQPATDYEALCRRATAIAATKNSALKAWAQELAQRADRLKQDAGRSTITQVKSLARDLANAETLAAGIRDETNTIANAIVTSYALPATTQDLLQPYDLPRAGRLSNTLNILAAQGEFESAIVVVVPFRPVASFTLQVGDLRSGANVIPASAVDPKVIKRWFRTGGAWMSYHADKRQRVLVLDLLVNDDRIIRVDELRASNELLMHFPRGDRYVDVSRYAYDQIDFNVNTDPFWDAPTLQPLALPEAGRNQPYNLTFHVPEAAAPGIYTGTVRLIADGKGVAEIAINLRVLPFALPEARTYYDISRPYYSHINSAPTDNREIFFKGVKNLKEHSLLHASRVADAPWQIELAKQAGYPLKELVGAGKPSPRDWKGNFGGPGASYHTDGPGVITVEDQVLLDRLFKRDLKRQLDYFDKYIGPDVSFFNVGSSESSYYGTLVIGMEQGADCFHETGRARLMTHGMVVDVPLFMGDYGDMDSTTYIKKEWADLWHVAGGRIMNYANPFPGAENPAWFRRRIGLQMYKANYDGQMLHGYAANFWNEFAEWPGGDGNYRHFGMVYPQKNGIINTLAIGGAREAYDDVRYATKLQTLALAHRDSKDIRVAREARRQLIWLERLDGEKADLDAFRIGAVHRILTLLDLIQLRGGK